MDGFNDDFTSSTSIKPKSSFQGNYEDDLIESMAFKLMIADKKRRMSPTVSSASKAAVPKRNVSKVRNETLGGEEQHRLSRSLSFDSKYSIDPVFDGHGDVKNSLAVVDSQFQPYDPIKNYLSPRPRFLRYDPSRHHEIFARQERVSSRVRRSASFDSRMQFSEEELKSNGDCCSLGSSSSSQEEFVEEKEKEEVIESSVGKDEDEHEEEETEEEFDDYEEDNDNRWISNVFLQYFLVTIAVILTTMIISSMNSPTPSPAREAVWGFVDLYRDTQSRIYQTVGLVFSQAGYEAFAPMMLIVGKFREVDYGNEEWDKKGVVVNTGELVERLEIAETEELENDEIDVNQDEGCFDQLEGLQTVETDELESGEIDVNQDEESFDQLEGLETEEIEELENDEIYNDQDEEDSDQLRGLEINENEEVEIKETDTQLQDPVFPISKEIEKTHEIEPKNESFSKSLSDDSNCIDASEELEPVKMMVEEDVVGKQDSNNGLYENDIKDTETTDFLIKLATFDPISTASIIGVSVLILASLSVLYYSNRTKASSPSETMIAHKNSTDRKYLEPFVNPSHSAYKMQNPLENEVSKTKDSNFSLSFTRSDAFSSSKRKSTHLELSTGDSLSGGSFTVEKKIVKKQKSKNPEVTLSTVRRSSRIHGRSVMSP